MDEYIPLSEVKKLWTIPGKKPPSTPTIWRYRRQGKIPAPIQLGRDNLYNQADVIRMRDEFLHKQR